MYIKACPFCGGKPYLEKSSRGFVNGESTKVCYVRCTKCNARSERVIVQDYGRSSQSAEANKRVIDAWNSRVTEVSSGIEINLDRKEDEWEGETFAQTAI